LTHLFELRTELWISALPLRSLRLGGRKFATPTNRRDAENAKDAQRVLNKRTKH
jgi:hypothetical protein